MAAVLAFLDFLQTWDIATLILAAAFLMVVVLIASYGMALAWRRWKDGRRAAAARARGLAPAPPPAPTGASFGSRARAVKLPKLPSLPRPALKLPGRKPKA